MVGVRDLMRQEKQNRARQALDKEKKNKECEIKFCELSFDPRITNTDHQTDIQANRIKKRRFESMSTSSNSPKDSFERAEKKLFNKIPNDSFDTQASPTPEPSGVRLPHDPLWISNIYDRSQAKIEENYFLESEETSSSSSVDETSQVHVSVEKRNSQYNESSLLQENTEKNLAENPEMYEKDIPDDFFDNEDLAPEELKKKRLRAKEMRLQSQLELFNQEIKNFKHMEIINGNGLHDSDTEINVSELDVSTETRGYFKRFLDNIKASKKLAKSTTLKDSINASQENFSTAPLPNGWSSDEDYSDGDTNFFDNTTWRSKTLRK